MLSKVKKLYQTAREHAGFKRYFKNTSWLFGGQMFRMLIGLFVSVAVARYLGPKDFGLFNYVMSIVALVGVVSQLGLRELARRELVESPERRNEIIGTCFVLNLIAGVVIYGVMLWVVFTQTESSLVIGLFALLGSPVLLLSSLGYVELWFQSQVRSDLSVRASSTSVAIFAVLKVVAIVQGTGLIAFAYLFVLEGITLCLLQIYFYGKHFGSIFQWQVRWSTAMTFLKQSWPLILSGLSIAIYTKIDQVMLGSMIGEEAVGQYSVAVRISTVWHFIPLILATSLFPAILNARKQSKELYEKRLQHYFDLSAGLAYLVAIPLSIAAPWIILLLFGDVYKTAGPIFAIHVWSCLFAFLGGAREQYLVAEKLFKFSMGCTIAGAIVNLVLNYYLIPSCGGIGAAVATLVSSSISAFFSSFLIANSQVELRHQIKSILIPLRMLRYFILPKVS
ncbi:MAG: O-antigen/teichoic acid export membrane protein [Candidatus Endobugula sp.]|jgi:O-antigen/teichoic acid export membrane protein